MLQKKDTRSGRAPKPSAKTTFTIKSVIEDRTFSQQQQEDKHFSNKDIRKNTNNQQGQCTGRNELDESGSDIYSDSWSSSTLSVRMILWPWNNNQREEYTKSIEQE